MDQASLAELIRGCMESLGLVQPVLIGHSHGGVLALRLAATEPALVGGLVLLCPAHPFGGYRGRVVNFYLRQPGRMLAVEYSAGAKLDDSARVQRGCGVEEPHPDAAFAAAPDGAAQPEHAASRTGHAEDVGQGHGRVARGFDSEGIPLPTVLIWGDEDPVVPIASAEALEAHLADSERVTLAGMGHLLAEEAPVECARLIGEWLLRLEA